MRAFTMLLALAEIGSASIQRVDESELNEFILHSFVLVFGGHLLDYMPTEIPEACGTGRGIVEGLCLWASMDEARFVEVAKDHVNDVHEFMIIGTDAGPGLMRNKAALQKQGLSAQEQLHAFTVRYHKMLRGLKECKEYL